jgi:hypothetical protein
LKHFVENGYQEDTQARFCEISKPSVFLSSPVFSLNDSSFKKLNALVDELKSNLTKKYGEKLHFRNLPSLQYSYWETAHAPISIRSLQTTRIFILIYVPTETGSYSMVELGQAIQCCKRVIVFYKKGSLSQNMERLRAIGVQMISFEDLAKELKYIQESIETELGLSLGEYVKVDQDITV